MSRKGKNEDISAGICWEPDRPFDEIPLLPPEEALESHTVLKRCIGARAALATLRTAAELIPNAEMLINTLPLLEAQASSEIENIVTTADELFRSLGTERAVNPATREALRYREALLMGSRQLEALPISTRMAESICTKIKGTEMRVRAVPGTAIANAATGEIVYTPPSGEARIRTLLANWERFLHAEDELDPLVRMAVSHYQFEAIHPFTDGNGRTGRVLNSLFLVEKGLLGLPVLYLSRYIIEHKQEYYRRLLAVTRERAWEPWLEYLLTGVERMSNWTVRKIEAIRKLSQHTESVVRYRLPKIYSRELIDVLFEQPYCRIADVVAKGIVHRQAASRYLKSLSNIGVVEEIKSGRRKLFLHSKLLQLLTRDENEFEPYPG